MKWKFTRHSFECRVSRAGFVAGAFGLVVVLVLVCTSCEQQDYAVVPEVLEVSASNGVLSSPIPAPLEHETITRHAVDYRVTNTGQETVEVVVFAQSSVNGVPRATGNHVHRLEGEAEASGRISELTLELGNALNLELQCCRRSQCNSLDVLCPEFEGDDDPRRAAPPYVCVDACFEREKCVETCPRDAECEAVCAEDLLCVGECPADVACAGICDEGAVACVASCLALYRRCGGEPDGAVSGVLPCGVCEGYEGLCSASVVSEAAVELQDAAGSIVRCAPSCVHYPAVCVTTCEEWFGGQGRDSLLDCAQSCILVFQAWCDRDPAAIDPNLAVPCCFSESCEASLEAVIKLAAVECLDDSVCGSGRRCNRMGMCENQLRDEQTGCQVTSLRGQWSSSLWVWLIVFGGVLWRGRTGRASGWRRWWWVFVFVFVLLVPTVSQAEPRGFRRTRSALVVGATVGNFVGGEVGDAARTGLGLSVSESIQSGYLGASMRLSGGLHPTSNESLPHDEGFQLYALTVGLRGILPIFDDLDLYVYLQPEYSFVGLQSNTLVMSTSNRNRLHGLGATLGAQLFAGGVLLETSVSASWLLQADTAYVVGALGVGFSGLL